MSDFLQSMAASSRARINDDPARVARLTTRAAALAPPPLQLSGFDVIAEIKKTSPAEGELDSNVDVAQRAGLYESAGACAVSVLTEPEKFHGDLDDLRNATATLSSVPAMRKDFLVGDSQIIEARAAGAGGVLLIAAMLADDRLLRMCEVALDFELFVLLEAFDESDVQRLRRLISRASFRQARQSGQLLLGVNTRDLRTLSVDPNRLQKLAPLLPSDIPCVAESGICDANDAGRAAELGYSLALVGSALMRSDDPGSLVTAMTQAGREARA